MNIAAIRKALAGAIPADLGLTVYELIPSAPDLPCVYPLFPDRLYEFSSTGRCTMDISLVLVVSRADEDTAQQQLSDFISNGEIIAALFAAPPTEWTDLALTEITDFTAATFGDRNVLAAHFNLSLITA